MTMDNMLETIEYQAWVPDKEQYAWLIDPNRDIRQEMLPMHLQDIDEFMEARVNDADDNFEDVDGYKKKKQAILEKRRKEWSIDLTTPTMKLVIAEGEDKVKAKLDELLKVLSPCCFKYPCFCTEEEKQAAKAKLAGAQN